MFRETSNITVFGKFSRYWEQKLTIIVDALLEKTAHVQLRYHTRLDKTVYGESGVKVSR